MEADEVPKDVTKRLKSFSLCPAILVSVLYAFRCTAETLNRRPHHLSDSVRQRERMSRSKMPLEYIHLGKHAIDTRPSDAIIERSPKDESVAGNDGDEHLEDAPSKENHKEGLEIEDDIGSENDHFDKPQAYNGRKREIMETWYLGSGNGGITVVDRGQDGGDGSGNGDITVVDRGQDGGDGYLKETIGYHFYNPHENKVFVARYAELFENSLQFTRSSGSLTLLKASGSIVGLDLLQKEDT
ncbi:hypothetical protein Tco_0270564 [Tanacetum coccineum]